MWCKSAVQVSVALLLTMAAALPAKSAGEPERAPTSAGTGAGAPVFVDQGLAWTAQARAQFYTLDQGSRIIPLGWLMALRLPDGRPFLHDGLARYGYLPNDVSPYRLPIGFTTAGPFGDEMVGMTCAACHTREIRAAGRSWRIDGGPSLVDFQAFARDLEIAARAVLEDPARHRQFVASVLGPNVGTAAEDALRWSFHAWYLRFRVLVDGSLPEVGRWGLGRLDAVSMIFNRLAGIDLAPPPHLVIAGNIARAEAPVRYPFLWNAHRQQVVQWTGIADNTSPASVLARNVGQVLGVFAEFRPMKQPGEGQSQTFDLFAVNSIAFANLKRLEALVWSIGAPRWPWPIDEALAARGRDLFETHCAACHGERPAGEFWQTDVYELAAIGTDRRAALLLMRDVDTGVFADAGFARREPAAKVLKLTTGALALLAEQDPQARSRIHAGPSQVEAQRENLRLLLANGAPETVAAAAPPRLGYVARVLRGVWAAAPYLHNGSVPTLDDLLKPAEQRPAEFAVGADYDIARVGLAAEQTGLATSFATTGCRDLVSGNSRCGHEYATRLAPDDRAALLEYLKKL